MEVTINRKAETQKILSRLRKHPFHASKIEVITGIPAGIISLVRRGYRQFTESQISKLDSFLRQYE